MENITKVNLLKDLIINMEQRVGGECYNSNIQNYGSWGSWEGEGREFKYPFHYYNKNKEKIKGRHINSDMSSEEITSVYYAFGANQLHIGRAIINLIDYIEKRYDIDFIELEKEIQNKSL